MSSDPKLIVAIRRPNGEKSRLEVESESGSIKGACSIVVSDASGCRASPWTIVSGKGRPEVALGRPNGAGARAPRKMATLGHSGIEVTFCVMRVWNPNGTMVESRPLTPTVLVSPTREDITQERDVDLEAAERRLRQILRK